MAVSEMWFRQQIPSILKFNGGAMTKTELVDFLTCYYQFDSEAMSPYPSRSQNEPRWHQLLGNIVSHAKSEMQIFPEGFVVLVQDPEKIRRTGSRRGCEYIFSLLSADQQVDVPENGVMMNLINNPCRIDHLSPSMGHVDMSQIAKKRYEVGLAGEQFVMNQERDFILSVCPQYIHQLEWTARDRGDGYGYDIKSIQHDNFKLPLYIEVKATATGDGKCPMFHVSKNEHNFIMAGVGKTDRIIRYLYGPNDQLTAFSSLDISADLYASKCQLIPQEYIAKLG